MKHSLFITGLLMAILTSLTNGEVRSVDDRLIIEPFAAAPDIVQPVSAIVAANGRLLVIENHSHFRPDDYEGPDADRLRWVEDVDGDGTAERFNTFFEGERDSMDLAEQSDGSIYLATRRQILRLEDVDGDGTVDESRTIVRLETTGDYPHNGLSGLAFDFAGNLHFGFGENLGAAYQIHGSDGTVLRGEAEGGSSYWCRADGAELRRVATGFWNPFGQCVDVYGNVFAVDNDPDASPPCRLLHVTQGANFGYQFRYGRSGKHPLQTWTGDLPGTLPMVAGTGEAPCEVLTYDHIGFPAEYRGDLLVASWGDHRIERYRLQREGASFRAERFVVVQGDADFWPVGMAVAPDGSLFITDWGSRSYPLHNQGGIWRLSVKDDQATWTGDPLLSPVRSVREAAARQAVEEGDGQAEPLITAATHERPEVRATALQAMAAAPRFKPAIERAAKEDDSIDVRALAVQLIAEQGIDVAEFARSEVPAPLRAVALQYLKGPASSELLQRAFTDADPAIRSAAVSSVSRHPQLLHAMAEATMGADQSVSAVTRGIALACEAATDEAGIRYLPSLLSSSDEQLRFIAARWIADKGLTEYAAALRAAVDLPTGDFRMLMGILAAIAHIDGKQFDGKAIRDELASILRDDNRTADVRRLALRAATPGTLPISLLRRLFSENDAQLRAETIWALAGDARPEAIDLLLDIIRDSNATEDERADALAALSPFAAGNTEWLLEFASLGQEELTRQAMQVLVGAELTDQQRDSLKAMRLSADCSPLRDRLLNIAIPTSPPVEDIEAWLARMNGDGNIHRGRRIFFNRQLVQCANCHTVHNRGAGIGPDLTGIGQSRSLRELLTAILLPSQRIAPQYQPWVIVTQDGKTQSGYHLASKNLVETFVDANGQQFDVPQEEIAERHASATSIMPTGLLNALTDAELRDLLAYVRWTR